MSAIPIFTLNNGVKLPAMGLGSWMGKPVEVDSQENRDTVTMVKTALKVGYRHVDTAAGYGNEEAVGIAIRESDVSREEIHVTTKVADDYTDIPASFEASMKRLNMEYLDLWLMHWPQSKDPKTGEFNPKGTSPTFCEAWAEMEKVYATGRVKAIGVSNFSIMNLEELLKTAKVVPAVNQVQIHPYMPQSELVEYCEKKGIHVTAYTPLGQKDSPIQKDPAVQAIAKAHNATEGQVLLSWVVQRGISAVPKSANEGRLRANLELLKLSGKEMETISDLSSQPGKLANMCQYGPLLTKDSIFGWRIVEDMGWDPKAYS